MTGARKVTDELRTGVRGELLSEMARSNDPEAVMSLARGHADTRDLFPGDLLIELAADALEVGGVSRAEPVDATDLRERMLPEREFSGNTDHQKSWAALRAAAMTHAGVRPNLLDDVGWWRVNDFWSYAALAFVIYVRAAAEHAGLSVSDICQRIQAKYDLAGRSV